MRALIIFGTAVLYVTAFCAVASADGLGPPDPYREFDLAWPMWYNPNVPPAPQPGDPDTKLFESQTAPGIYVRQPGFFARTPGFHEVRPLDEVDETSPPFGFVSPTGPTTVIIIQTGPTYQAPPYTYGGGYGYGRTAPHYGPRRPYRSIPNRYGGNGSSLGVYGAPPAY